MPLSQLQRTTLREVLSDHIDSILADPTAEEYLPQVIDNIALSIPEVIVFLNSNRHLIEDVTGAVNLDASTRNDLNGLLDKLDSDRPIIPQSLLYRHPNYNPVNIVEMKKFSDRVAAAKVSEPFRSSLIALRELFLEMTPLGEASSYVDETQVYKFRIGSVPLQLDKMGDPPKSGDVSEEVFQYISLRLKFHEEYKSRIDALNEGMSTPSLREEKNKRQGAPPPTFLKSSVSASSSVLQDVSHVVLAEKNPLESDTSGNALCCLGLQCHFGPEHDMIKAVEWYRKGAERGHLLSMWMMRYCYMEGLGVEKDVRMSDTFRGQFEKQTKKYQHEAEQELPDNDSSFKLLERMSNSGNKEVQLLMGVCLDFGLGSSKCEKTAVKWYRLSAEQGCARAQFNLGACYWGGEGVAQSYEEAVNWFRSSAEQGDAHAQYNLGVCYESGRGVEKNGAEAVKWYRLSAEQGDEKARTALHNLQLPWWKRLF